MVFSQAYLNTITSRDERTNMVELMRLIRVMLLFFLSFQAGLHQTEASDTCEVRSAYFLSLCLIDHHCEMVCKVEGFPTGKCLGLVPHCICLGTCKQPSPPSPSPENSPESSPPVPPPVPQYSQPPPQPEYSLPPSVPEYSQPSPQSEYSLPPSPSEYFPPSADDLQ